LPFGIQLFTDSRVSGEYVAGYRERLHCLSAFSSSLTGVRILRETGVISPSPLPFGIQLFTDTVTGLSMQFDADEVSPLPFGIQLFTDSANDREGRQEILVSIAFRHSALH